MSMNKADEVYVEVTELYHAGIVDDDRYWEIVDALDDATETELDEMKAELSKTWECFFSVLARM